SVQSSRCSRSTAGRSTRPSLTREPHHPPACGRRRATGPHVVQTRGRLTSAVGVVPGVLQLLLASRWLTPDFTTARADPRHGLSQAGAAPNAGNGGWADRSRVDAARGAAVPRAAVAPASRGVSKQGGGKQDGEVV